MQMKKKKAIVALAALAAAGVAHAADIDVTDDIAVSTTWTADNTYNLTKQIFVLPGATLTIEAGTLVASTPTANGSGSLAVTRGAKIFVNGTEDAPVIMTSTNDDLETWREAANEWGNLTIMGNGLISASHFGGQPVVVNNNGNIRQNTKVPDGLNQKQMEGLVAAFPGDSKVLYGGDNDDDDSGSISYLSIRYGGRVVGIGDELNGLSLGAIGRETDIHHVEIMNNVDDGIEIWGGTVNLKYVSIWNVGDDSFDVDQGWRGKAQFGLIVQGYSVDADQGSGVGDNCFETDGAEDSDAQPVTTATIYNFTAIGQPLAGDGGTTWRDNARVQYRNCIFMDLGDQLVRFDDDDGDGAQGYGFNNTLSWPETWTTPYTSTSAVNIGDGDSAELYQAQASGNLAEITDSVFFRLLAGNALTEATARGVLDASNNNVNNAASLNENEAPIQAIVRPGAPVMKGGLNLLPVTSLNPCAANEALMSVATAPVDGFFTPAPFRGGFSKDNNWLKGWSAADAYGFLTDKVTPDDPDESIQLTATVCFETEEGVVYTVEESSDNQNWSPVDTIVGDGSAFKVTDLDQFDSAKFYRVIVQ